MTQFYYLLATSLQCMCSAVLVHVLCMCSACVPLGLHSHLGVGEHRRILHVRLSQQRHRGLSRPVGGGGAERYSHSRGIATVSDNHSNLSHGNLSEAEEQSGSTKGSTAATLKPCSGLKPCLITRACSSSSLPAVSQSASKLVSQCK